LGFGNGIHDILASQKRSITGIHVFFLNNVEFAWTVCFFWTNLRTNFTELNYMSS
jgi:hypothetical protein